ncbi:MAG: type II toxin-antitoxin system HicB family antitoxin [Anaerolineaceae bacterium]|nr:type II toxin-antitoxin system HicB family antitoxin [Anaerolineaceae bacterium]
MNRDDLWSQAGKLAARDYRVEYEWDELLDGSPVVMASNPALPGCMAQGATEDEARRELSEARQEYVYALLEDGEQVPEPERVAPPVSGNPYEVALFAEWSWMEDDSINIRNTRDSCREYLTEAIVVERHLVPA